MIEEYKLPLHDRFKNLTGYCLVSKEDYEHLSKLKWSQNKKGYVCSTINGVPWNIHRYIMIVLRKMNLVSKQLVDHINNNKADNRRENLRVCTSTENARNKKKKENTSSKYICVSYEKTLCKWIARLKLGGGKKDLRAQYEKEDHAAYQVNLWVEEYKLEFAKVNEVTKPDDFILYEHTKKKENLPKGIFLVHYKNKDKNRYRVAYKKNGTSYHLGDFDTLDEAIACNKKKELYLQEQKEKEILATPIKYDKDGNCIIEIFTRKKVKVGETIVDEDIYYDLLKYNWLINDKGYAIGLLDKKNILLARYVINYYGENMVDHINGNRLDNRKSNLRVVTVKQNNTNKSSAKNSSSKYIGVSFHKRDEIWSAMVRYKGKNKHLGNFVIEDEAARARDAAAKIYYGEHAKLNFPN